jgi:predicted MPP superfamily phosphohydrolase
MKFIRRAVDISPVYYVTGNHEIKSGQYSVLYSELKKTEVILLENESRTLKYNGGEFNFIGLHDVSSFASDPSDIDAKAKEKLKSRLKSLISGDSSRLNVLLSHRPELIDIYSECGADLVLSGHAHGGQARLPLAGGLYAPGQGVLPKYTSGMYYYGSTALIVSRGLGNSLFPLRIFNPPEIVSVTLKSGQP